jgi:hypothetical protein
MVACKYPAIRVRSSWNVPRVELQRLKVLAQVGHDEGGMCVREKNNKKWE